ncbi:MAG: hypothetical protein MMC33_000284 [Icmadophila ericetorum]|nr:hypothetical protein [Icmadophila ericetorum]
MPHILSIPRELRDEIYKHNLQEPLTASPPTLQSQSTLSRQTVLCLETDPDYHFGEVSVRYPTLTPLPPSHGLLQTCRQLRAELLDCIRRMPIRYKIDLASRTDKDVLYPTWVSIPAFVKHIDVLDVQLRLRYGKTSSIISTASNFPQGDYNDAVYKLRSDPFFGGLALLQRFLERGVYFLSKKKRERISVGTLAVNVSVVKEDEQQALDQARELADDLDTWLRGETEPSFTSSMHEDKGREDEQFRILAGKVERVVLSIVGRREREWVLQEMLAAREKTREVDREREREAAAAAEERRLQELVVAESGS